MSTVPQYGSGSGGNTASGESATVGGGYSNSASGSSATVGGGIGNMASQTWATVGGGYGNTASGSSSTVGGGSENVANGQQATVPGGFQNVAGGDNSFAAGSTVNVLSDHNGAMLFSDDSTLGYLSFNSVAPQEFAVRSTGGVRFVTAIDGTGNPAATTVITPQGQLVVGVGAAPSPFTTNNASMVQVNDVVNNANGSLALQTNYTSSPQFQAISFMDGGGRVVGGIKHTNVAGGQTQLDFYAQPNGGSHGFTQLTDIMTLQGSNGNVGIGTQTPAYPLDVAGQAHATGFPVSSDMRFKTDIQPVQNALSKILRLNGVYFKWNRLHRETLKRSNTRTRQVGLIAQQVKEVLPEVVSEWADKGADDYLAVDYNRLVAVLIEAMKEQQEQFKSEYDTLRTQIQELKQTIKKLTAN